MTVILNRFDDTNPLNTDGVNENFQALVAAINALGGSNLLQLGVVTDDSPQYMPKTGGTFIGQITAPSIMIGASPAVSRADLATTVVAGVVKQAAILADFATSISNPPTQAEVNALKAHLNTLLANLRAAGLQAT